MQIPLSALPPELQRRLREEAGLKPRAAARRQSRPLAAPPRLRRICSCLFEIFRPDGVYPECCDGCGAKWPE